MIPEQLFKEMFCINCGNHDLTVLVDESIKCPACSSVYPSINHICSFVDAGLVSFSEVPEERRDNFIMMKELAYFKKTFVQQLYTHYHRYAAQQRKKFGDGGVILDIGTGVGEHAAFIEEHELRNQSFVGIDIDRFKLEQFKKRYPGISLMQAEATRLPFDKESISVVQYLAVLEHLDSQSFKNVIREGLRVLKKGGILIACYPAEGSVFLRLSQKVMHFFLKSKTSYDLEKESAHNHLCTATEIRRFLKRETALISIGSFFYPFALPFIHASLFINEVYEKK